MSNQSLINAAQDFLARNLQQTQKYLGPDLLAKILQEMESRNAIPSVTSAEISFKRLVEDGQIQRTDGKTARDDFNEEVKRAQRNLDKAIREVDAPDLSVAELAYFASLGQRDLSALYFGKDGSATNTFAVRYRKAMCIHNFSEPLRFGQPKQEDDIELSAEEYRHMSAQDVCQKLFRSPAFKRAVNKLIDAGQIVLLFSSPVV